MIGDSITYAGFITPSRAKFVLDRDQVEALIKYRNGLIRAGESNPVYKNHSFDKEIARVTQFIINNLDNQ